MFTYIWQGSELDGEPHFGTYKGFAPIGYKRTLARNNIYRVKFRWIPPYAAKRELSPEKLKLAIWNLRLLLTAGIPMRNSITQTLLQERDTETRFALITILEGMDQGLSLGEASERTRGKFPDFFSMVLRLTDKTDQWPRVFFNLERFLETEINARKNISSAFRYPAFLFLFVSILYLALLLFVIPSQKALYELVGGELPLITRLFIRASDYILLNSDWFAVGFGITVASILLPFTRRRIFRLISAPFRMFFAKHYLPIHFSSSMAILSKSGISLENALAGIGKTSKSKERKLFEDIIDGMDQGLGLAESIRERTKLPGIFIQLLSGAEKVDKMSEAFESISDYLSAKLTEAMRHQTARIQPALITLVSLLVLVGALAIYLPLFNIAPTGF